MQVTSNTSSKIKPIETEYKGYRFRSRLEARWAVYFDTLGLKWEYEIDGYDLGKWGWYLPDFYLTQVRSFAEVKPSDYRMEDDYGKYAEFVKRTEREIIILSGAPEIKFYPCFFRINEGGHEIIQVLPVYVSNHHNYPDDEHRFYSNPGYDNPYQEGLSDEWDENAVIKARSARFEHGETP